MHLNTNINSEIYKLEISIYSEIILKSHYFCDVKNGGNGARLYFLAKNWDKSKRGSILESEFRSYVVNDLKVKDWNYRRWLNSAIDIGLINRTKTKKGKKFLLTGYRRACGLLGIDHLQPMQAIKIKDFMGKNWATEIYACFLATVQGRPMSRATIEILSGVKQSTQRNLEKRTKKINNIRNYAKDASLDQSNLTGFKEHIKKSAFINAGQITWRLPDTKEIKGIQVKRKTSTLKHINSFIRRSSCIVAGKIYSRLYCENDKELKKAEKHREGNYLYLESKQQGFYHAISYVH